MAEKKETIKTKKDTKKKTTVKKEEKEKKVKSAQVEKTEKAKEEAAPAPNATLQKKRERREAKAARKAANMVEEKKSRPNNILLTVMIFGVLIGMFAIVVGYNYFSKPASLEKYIEDNGGADLYGNFMIDENTKANITAEGNSLNMELTAETEDEDLIKAIKESYDGDEGKEQMEDLTAYFLTSLKPLVRGLSADATTTMSLNGEELNSVKMTYREAKKYLKDAQREAEDAADDADDIEAETEETEEAEE